MSTPNSKELDWAIAELEGQESSKERYILLAALYTCRDHMLGPNAPQPQIAAYSEAAPPDNGALPQYGDSEFLQAVSGKDSFDVLGVLNEHMETLSVVNPRAYESVLRKINRL